MLAVFAIGANITVRAAAGKDEVKRVGAATAVLNEMMRARDKAIPGSILEKAEAIAIFPGVKKAGFVVGGQWGRGIISVRDVTTRQWSSPAFLTMTGGSVGAQIGGTEIDVILVIMNRSGVEHLLSNQVKLGGEISAAAGPVGRGVKRQPTCRWTLRFSAIRAAGECLLAPRSTARSSRKTWTPIRAFMRRLFLRGHRFERAGNSPASVGVLKTALARHSSK